MGTFGIEGIEDFSGFRNSGIDKAEETGDGWWVWPICDGLDEELREAGHIRRFYWGDDDCWEIDLRDSTKTRTL